METGPFAVGERALVPFTDKNYEAKVLKAEFRCAKAERRECNRPELCASVFRWQTLPLFVIPCWACRMEWSRMEWSHGISHSAWLHGLCMAAL